MTINDSINVLKIMASELHDGTRYLPKHEQEFRRAYETAIRSLEAWDKVLEETSNFEEEVFDRTKDFSDYGAVRYVLDDIIKKHLKQI